MLRKNYNEDLRKLDNLEKTYQLIKNRAETIRQQFLNDEIYEDTIEGKKLGKELDTSEELEEFLNDEVVTFERDKDFKIIRDKKFGAWENYVTDILFDMKDIKSDKLYFYDKYKDDDRLYELYLNSMSIWDKVLDVKHFKELLIYLDNEKYIDEVKTAKFEFTILDKEHEDRREFNEYKFIITCNNGLELDLFANGRTETHEKVKIYSKDYEEDYSFIGTHIKEIVNKFSLLKMIRTAITGIENKKYKMYLKKG
ncbi:hypothetical protein [Arcobacter sp.]|uniref:hypothetical protein n=1 Tax=unclassified Arcobacter TaxID=2593671 RepID=UPI003B006E23